MRSRCRPVISRRIFCETNLSTIACAARKVISIRMAASATFVCGFAINDSASAMQFFGARISAAASKSRTRSFFALTSAVIKRSDSAATSSNQALCQRENFSAVKALASVRARIVRCASVDAWPETRVAGNLAPIEMRRAACACAMLSLSFAYGCVMP